MEIREEDFRDLIRGHNRVLYLCHRNADPDAVGSAFALREAFGGDIGAVEGVSRTAASLRSAMGADIEIDPSPQGYDLVVVVDTAVGQQIGGFNLRDYAVVDHHRDRDLIESALFYIQRPADSTAEIVWEILKRSDILPTREAALGLVVGIITDTGRFKHSGASSFRTVAEILERTKLEYAEALEVLSRVPTERSRRIAALRAASRAEIEWTDDWVVVSSEVGAFEGSTRHDPRRDRGGRRPRRRRTTETSPGSAAAPGGTPSWPASTSPRSWGRWRGDAAGMGAATGAPPPWRRRGRWRISSRSAGEGWWRR